MSTPDDHIPEEEQEKKKPEGYRDLASAFALITQLGISMATCVFVGVMLGRTLDNLLGTAPFLLLTCALLGAAASFKVLYDMALKKWMK